MQVAHQHHGVVIDRGAVAAEGVFDVTEGIANRGLYPLAMIHGGADRHLCTQLVHVLTAITGVVHHVVVSVGDVGRLAPVRFDGDAGHTIGHIEVGALREHTTAYRVKVLVRALAVGIVVVGIVLDASRGIVGRCIGVGGGHGRHRRNLPACDDAVFCIVAFTDVVVVRQLNLVVVEVIAVKVLVGAVEGKARFGYIGSRRP